MNLPSNYRCGKAGLDSDGVGSQIEDAPRDGLQFSNQLVELGRFGIELADTSSKPAQIRDHIRKSLQDIANGVEFVAGRCVELGGFDQMGGDFEFYRSRHVRCKIEEVC